MRNGIKLYLKNPVQCLLAFFTAIALIFLFLPVRVSAQTNTFPATGYVGIGTTVPGFALTMFGTDWNGSQISLTTFAGSPTPGGTDNYTPQFRFEKARGTASVPTKVVDGDRIGAFLAAGHDGSKMQRSAVFGFRVDGTTSTGVVPIGFFVQTGDASTNKPERFIINSNGWMGLGDSYPGAEMHVAKDFRVLFGDSLEGNGAKTFWLPALNAFRTGGVSGSQWDLSNIGNYSFATGRDTRATSAYTTALGDQTTASGAGSTAMGYLTQATNTTATAMGSATTASGFHATSMGEATTASGKSTTATGSSTTAVGDYSFSMGEGTIAQAYASVAIGTYNIPAGNPVGFVPTDPLFVAGNGTGMSPSNAMTLYKNGDVNFSGIISGDGSGLTNIPGDADWTFMPGSPSAIFNMNDYVGIGTIPVVPFHVFNLLDVLYGLAPTGTGTRFHWVSGAGALRAGTVTGTQWDPVNLGQNSFSSGFDNTALGPESATFGNANFAGAPNCFATGLNTSAALPQSFTMGDATFAGGPNTLASGLGTSAIGPNAVSFNEGGQAIGPNSMVSGFFTIASGQNSAAFGLSTQATNLASTSFGDNTLASGAFATSFGDLTRATGSNSTSMGFQTVANATNATALGDSTQANGWNATSMGYFTRAFGDHSTVMGVREPTAPVPTDAQSYAQLTIGAGNWQSGIENPLVWMAEDPIFQIGIAPSPVFCLPGQTDAVHVNKMGQVGLGMSPIVSMFPGVFQLELSTPMAAMPGGGPWLASSDRRLKQDIRPFEDGLEVIRGIRPVRFRYNEKAGYQTDREYVGVIAQEVQEVAPYMVIESPEAARDGRRYLAFDGKAMDYLLVNSIKTLDGKLQSKDAEIARLNDRILALEGRLSRFEQALSGCCFDEDPGSQSIPTGSTDGAVLEQNVPNPFDVATTIRYYLPEAVRNALIRVTDLSGKTLISFRLNESGFGSVEVDAGSLSEGTYLYSLIVDGKMVQTRRMILTN
jgi:hypothetical protein